MHMYHVFVDFPDSVTFAALKQNYKRKNKPVQNKSGSITTVYLCNYARKLGYSCKRQIRTVELGDSIIVEWNGKECDHKLDNRKRETTFTVKQIKSLKIVSSLASKVDLLTFSPLIFNVFAAKKNNQYTTLNLTNSPLIFNDFAAKANKFAAICLRFRL